MNRKKDRHHTLILATVSFAYSSSQPYLEKPIKVLAIVSFPPNYKSLLYHSIEERLALVYLRTYARLRLC